jgi:3-phytase
VRIRLEEREGHVGGSIVQRFAVPSQPEACVSDDAAGRLFFGEEKRGVWMLDTRDPAARPRLVLPAGGPLVPDVEGLALHLSPQGRYLVISSQGNNSYVVADADPPFAVRGAFRIGMNASAGIDGASETDGLEVTARALDARYPRGLLVVQDGFKRLPDGPQNFKLVPWDAVVRALRLP